jgi:hypothetical protein
MSIGDDIMAYEYRMLQIPPEIYVKSGSLKGQEASNYLQETVAKNTENGWEFYRVDAIGVKQRPGCMAALFGARATDYIYYVITFRRSR